MVEKSNKTKSWLIELMNKICKTLDTLKKKKNRKPKYMTTVQRSDQAAVAKGSRLGGLNSRNWFSHSSGARSSRSRCHQGEFLVRLLLTCRQPPSHCGLPGGVQRETEMDRDRAHQVFGVSSSSYKDQGPTLMTSFNLNYLQYKPYFQT